MHRILVFCIDDVSMTSCNNFCKIHPIAVRHIKIGVRTAVIQYKLYN